MNTDDAGLISYVFEKNHLPKSLEARRFSSGVANRSYAIGEDYVLKIEGQWKGILAHYKKTTDKLISVKAKVPKILDGAEFEGSAYLLMEKVHGTNLVYDWLKFDIQEKEYLIAQLAEELKKFHSIRFDDYAIRIGTSPMVGSGIHKENLKDAVAQITDFESIKGYLSDGNLKKEIEVIESFWATRQSDLDETGTAVLVHNDLHFENIFHEGRTVTGIIDFDWVCQAPKDYELRKVIEVFRMPHYAVEQHLEPVYENYRMIPELGFLKKHYPELFEHPNLTNRIRLYYVEKIIERIKKFKTEGRGEKYLRRIHEEIEDIYTGWLDRILD